MAPQCEPPAAEVPRYCRSDGVTVQLVYILWLLNKGKEASICGERILKVPGDLIHI